MTNMPGRVLVRMPLPLEGSTEISSRSGDCFIKFRTLGADLLRFFLPFARSCYAVNGRKRQINTQKQSGTRRSMT